ncbi:hypothetical protein ACFWPX_29600 [Nocardia sp. NPDC058518]|uniref:hypothetical protein n=1 Tax=Nocardia sp. NPDC058518 TaxID=3346534 RepID=UPI00365AFE70
MTDLAVGLYAVRTFCVDPSGRLLPVAAHRYYRGANAWTRGHCIATCLAYPGSVHNVPDETCDCGIYAFADTRPLRAQYSQAHGLVAVIALEGAVLEGEHGYRAQAARVVALWAEPTVVDPSLRSKITDNLDDDVTFYDDLDTMVAAYPGLRHTPTTQLATPKKADVRLTSTLPRRQLVKAATTTTKWWARVAAYVAVFSFWPIWNHYATNSGFDPATYPIFDAAMSIPRWLHRFGTTLGAPTWMWLGLAPAAVVAGLYAVPTTRHTASRLVAPAEGLIQVTVAAVITATLFGTPSIGHSPVSWILATTLTIAAVTMRPIASARKLRDPASNQLS